LAVFERPPRTSVLFPHRNSPLLSLMHHHNPGHSTTTPQSPQEVPTPTSDSKRLEGTLPAQVAGHRRCPPLELSVTTSISESSHLPTPLSESSGRCNSAHGSESDADAADTPASPRCSPNTNTNNTTPDQQQLTCHANNNNNINNSNNSNHHHNQAYLLRSSEQVRVSFLSSLPLSFLSR
jgi:hypothetical protein